MNVNVKHIIDVLSLRLKGSHLLPTKLKAFAAGAAHLAQRQERLELFCAPDPDGIGVWFRNLSLGMPALYLEYPALYQRLSKANLRRIPLKNGLPKMDMQKALLEYFNAVENTPLEDEAVLYQTVYKNPNFRKIALPSFLDYIDSLENLRQRFQNVSLPEALSELAQEIHKLSKTNFRLNLNFGENGMSMDNFLPFPRTIDLAKKIRAIGISSLSIKENLTKEDKKSLEKYLLKAVETEYPVKFYTFANNKENCSFFLGGCFGPMDPRVEAAIQLKERGFTCSEIALPSLPAGKELAIPGTLQPAFPTGKTDIIKTNEGLLEIEIPMPNGAWKSFNFLPPNQRIVYKVIASSLETLYHAICGLREDLSHDIALTYTQLNAAYHQIIFEIEEADPLIFARAKQIPFVILSQRISRAFSEEKLMDALGYWLESDQEMNYLDVKKILEILNIRTTEEAEGAWKRICRKWDEETQKGKIDVDVTDARATEGWALDAIIYALGLKKSPLSLAVLTGGLEAFIKFNFTKELALFANFRLLGEVGDESCMEAILEYLKISRSPELPYQSLEMDYDAVIALAKILLRTKPKDRDLTQKTISQLEDMIKGVKFQRPNPRGHMPRHITLFSVALKLFKDYLDSLPEIDKLKTAEAEPLPKTEPLLSLLSKEEEVKKK